MAVLRFGTVREVWFAKLADPATKWSFLIRDDAYSRSGAIFGRTLRLGDPVDLGPNSTWKQTTWEGGRDQEVWRDQAMFEKGNVDPTTKSGKLKLWKGFRQIHGTTNRGITRYTMSPGATGISNDTPIYLGEANLTGKIDPTSGTTVPPSGFNFGRYDPSTDTWNSITSFGSSINALVRSSDPPGIEKIFIGCGNGQFWGYTISGGGTVLEVAGEGIEVDSMVSYNEAIYYGAGRKLWKRIHNGTSPVHSVVKEVNGALTVRGLAVWNNRLWFCAVSTGSLTQVLVTDGTTVTPAFAFPQAFEVRAVAVHYGALYFAGDSSAGRTTGSYVGQIWRYTGSSLTKIYEEGTGNDAEQHVFWDLASWGKYLVWGRPGTPTSKFPGVMMYDAEADAIIEGPSFDMDASAGTVAPGSLHVWNNTLIGSWTDFTNYGGALPNKPTVAAHVKTTDAVRHTFTGFSGRAFEAQPSMLERYCLSSRFDGDIPGEQKVWLNCRIRCKTEANTIIEVRVLLDESTTEQTIGTITHTASGWRTVAFPMKASGTYIKATAIQYKVYLRNTESANADSTANPQVDSIEVDYMPSPKKRRAWRMRVVASEGQTRLDGSANNLTTTTALIDKLEELWAEQQPILFWDAGTAGGVPAGAGTEVMVGDYVSQPYRLESTSNDLGAEIAFSLTEVVQ